MTKKRNFIVAMLLLVATTLSAQVNVQMHYDLGRTLNPNSEPSRPNVTTTVEMFKPDALGSTYFFIDMDYYHTGVAGAYWEISREFNYLKTSENSSLAAHVEYDGGLSTSQSQTAGSYFSRFQQAALVGTSWNWHSADFSRTFSLQVLYKQFFANSEKNLDAHASFQLTPVWGITFANGWCTFSGFADLWYGYVPRFDEVGAQKKGLVFLTEPQLWANIKPVKGLSVGTECEISNDFVWANTKRSFMVNPTVAVKYAF